MMSSPGVAPGETTTGSGNVGSNDGARNAVGLFHVVVVSGVLQKTRKSDEGRPRGAPRPSTGALCIFQGGRTSRKPAAGMPRSCAARRHGGGLHDQATAERRLKAPRIQYGRKAQGARTPPPGCRTLAEDPGRTQPRAAYPRRCSSNASGLHGRNSARILRILATFQRDNLRRHF
jgi:hypothetical protein